MVVYGAVCCLCSIDRPPVLFSLCQTQVCRVRRKTHGSADSATELGESLPFLEYALYRQMILKLRARAMNSAFNLRVQVRVIVGFPVQSGRHSASSSSFASLLILRLFYPGKCGPIQILLSQNMIVAVATGTAVHVAALDMPPELEVGVWRSRGSCNSIPVLFDSPGPFQFCFVISAVFWRHCGWPSG